MAVQVSQGTYDLVLATRDAFGNNVQTLQAQLAQAQTNLDDAISRRDELTAVLADLEVE